MEETCVFLFKLFRQPFYYTTDRRYILVLINLDVANDVENNFLRLFTCFFDLTGVV